MTRVFSALTISQVSLSLKPIRICIYLTYSKPKYSYIYIYLKIIIIKYNNNNFLVTLDVPRLQQQQYKKFANSDELKAFK